MIDKSKFFQKTKAEFGAKSELKSDSKSKSKSALKNELLKKAFSIFFVIFFTTAFSGCYSVFSGGTGGLVVDKESTSTPKSGIANVDVYAYLNEDERNRDFEKWQEGTIFSPSADYYGHTTTSSDGHFSISKLTWKENSPDFGKDADYTNVFLLFFHENYGLTKGQTVIISDSTSDTVYAELVSTRKTTILSLEFIDVATDNTTTQNIFVKVEVPQATENLPDAKPKVYETTLAGSGNISVSYPRWKNNEERTSGKENSPEISISYIQSADEITWAACYNGDNEEKNYAFRNDAQTGIKRTIKNSNYSLRFYGKSQKLKMPSFSGQFLTEIDGETSDETNDSSATENSSSTKSTLGTSKDDGILISLLQKDSEGNYTKDSGQVYTQAQAVGTGGTEKHGVFSGLGNGSYWMDREYTQKFAETKVKIQAKNAENSYSENTTSSKNDSGKVLKEKELTIRSDVTSVNVQF